MAQNVKKVSQETIDELPFATQVRGMETKPVVCEQFNPFPGMGLGKCFHSPNMEDRYIDDLGVNEVFYCAEGVLVVAQLEDGEEVKEVRAKEGEFILLPEGNDYVLKASGVASENVFFNVSEEGWDIETYDEELAQELQKFD